MSLEEYFGDWLKVIDRNVLSKVVYKINSLYSNKKCCPEYSNIFKVFNITPYKELCVVILGQDPYFDGKATGIAFGNASNVNNISPSLNILKEASIDYTIPHNSVTFDNTLESWCSQGILLLNSALTVEHNNPGSHILIWREFIICLLKHLSEYNPGLIYVLLGSTAKSYSSYIKTGSEVITLPHPAYYVRNNTKMPESVFHNVQNYVKYYFSKNIKFYDEIYY